MEVEVKVKYGALKNLIKAMAKQYTVKVGILANKGGGELVSENLDLAGLGAVQEFGCSISVTDKMRGFLGANGLHLKKSTTHIVIPPRSFLQMPLMSGKLKKEVLSGFNADERATFIDYMAENGDMMSIAVLLGAGAERLIKEAFDTGGFGQWQPNHPFTIKMKGSELPLSDIGRLKNSITYEVEENG